MQKFAPMEQLLAAQVRIASLLPARASRIYSMESSFFKLRRAFHKNWATTSTHNDFWEVDPPFYEPGEEGSYDFLFAKLLAEERVSTFSEWLSRRKEQGEQTHVLELFGSGYFVDHPEYADSITGVRLEENSEKVAAVLGRNLDRNRDEDGKELKRWQQTKYRRALDHLQRIRQLPQWKVIEGNIYKASTWQAITQRQTQTGIPAFDLIVIKPEGMFRPQNILAANDWGAGDREERYGAIFLRVLENAYARLSGKEGMLLFDTPVFGRFEEVRDSFLSVLKNTPGLKVSTAPHEYFSSRLFVKLIRSSTAPETLRELVIDK